MVTVTDEGVHKDSVIPYPAGVTPDHLYAISNLLTERLAGKRVSEYPKVMQELGKEMSGQRELFTRLMDSLQKQMDRTRTPCTWPARPGCSPIPSTAT